MAKLSFFQHCTFLFFILNLLLYCVIASRKITTHLQYDCDIDECRNATSNSSVLNLGYIRADGRNDSLHYLISTIGLPTVLSVKTALNMPDPTVDWKELVHGNIADSITFQDKVQFSYGATFFKMFEYNDTDDNADMAKYGPYTKTEWKIHDFSQFHWSIMENLDQNGAFIISALTDGSDYINKTLSFSFIARDHEQRDKILPHLLYNDNITQIEFLLDNFTPSFKLSRFGLELVLFSSGKTQDQPEKLDTEKTLDDEHTPGVFELISWLTGPSGALNNGYFQWKPVVYAIEKRSRNYARKVETYGLHTVFSNDTETRNSFNNTIVHAFYDDTIFNSLSMQKLNVSFGLPDDGTYVKTNYSVWTTNLGYGIPPQDEISTLVIIVISCGLGIPVIVMVFGGTYVVVKKQRTRRRAAAGVNTSYPVVQ